MKPPPSHGIHWDGSRWPSAKSTHSPQPSCNTITRISRILEISRKSIGTMRCAEVLFERESLSWDHQSSRQKRQALTEEAQERVGEADHDSGCLNPGETQSRRVYPTSGVYPTLSTREKSGQNQESVFTQFGDDVAGTLTSRYDSSPCVDRGANVVVDERDKVFLCQTAQTGSNGKLVKQDDVTNTLDRTNSTAVAALDFNPTDARLRYAQKEHAPDGPRYKALGNSMAVPVMRWIGERIRTVEEAAETTG